jgi:ABC-type uncharacterized transport system auxiliary subunit
MLLAAIIAATGCATPKFTPPTKYVLEPQVKVEAVPTTQKTLGIRSLQAARPYKQKVVYRDVGFVLGEYACIEWAEMPADTLTRVLTDALVSTHRFKDVGEASDLSVPDLVLTGEVRRFYVDRTTESWTAVCEARVEIRDSASPDAVWAETLRETEPLERNEPSALPAAMTRVVEKIIGKAASEIAASRVL